MGAASARVETPDAAPTAPEIKGPIGALFKSDKARAMITPLLRGVSYEAVISETYILLKKKPELLKCTGESILWSVADCLRVGLVFGETAHMVPFNTKVTTVDPGTGRESEHWEDRANFIVGWKGAIELVVSSGVARDVDAQLVYENEFVYPDPRKNFDVRYGSDPDINHYPQLRAEDRGALAGSYAVARLNQTQKKVLWMPLSESEAIRQKYSKQHKKGPMPDWYPRKTVVLHLCNKLPKNAKLREYMQVMEHSLEMESIEEVEARVTDAPRMLGEGAIQPIDTRRAQGVPEYSWLDDDDRIEAANRAMANVEDIDPRGEPGHKAPF